MQATTARLAPTMPSRMLATMTRFALQALFIQSSALLNNGLLIRDKVAVTLVRLVYAASVEVRPTVPLALTVVLTPSTTAPMDTMVRPLKEKVNRHSRLPAPSVTLVMRAVNPSCATTAPKVSSVKPNRTGRDPMALPQPKNLVQFALQVTIAQPLWPHP